MDRVMAEGMQHSPYASHLETNYHFTRDADLRTRYCRLGGSSIRYGKIIEELDAVAGDVAYKYLMADLSEDTFDPELRPYNLVTVSVDRIDFMDKLSAERDLRLSGYMLMARGSTLMIKIDVL